MPQVVPLQAIPNQTVQCQLGNQACTLNVVQQAFGLFMDVYVGGTLICAGVICLNATLIVRYAYLGFIGDFIFLDTSLDGADPNYVGLGQQFQLVYLNAAEISALNLPAGIT